MTIVERHGYATRRPGEHVSGKVRAALLALGVPDAPELRSFSPGVLSFWARDTPDWRSYAGPDGAHGFNLSRAGFDAHLLAHAKASGADVVRCANTRPP